MLWQTKFLAHESLLYGGSLAILPPPAQVKNEETNLPRSRDSESRVENAGDECDHIHHVFANLISNVAKHSKAGDEILVEAKQPEDRWRFSVIDHGTDISKLQFADRIKA